MYPIIKLNRRWGGVKMSMCGQLESIGIELLAGLGVEAQRQKRPCGIVIGGRKIASIGVQIKKWGHVSRQSRLISAMIWRYSSLLGRAGWMGRDDVGIGGDGTEGGYGGGKENVDGLWRKSIYTRLIEDVRRFSGKR
jgi:hypothetical protein